jgi:hypothetical protein
MTLRLSHLVRVMTSTAQLRRLDIEALAGGTLVLVLVVAMTLLATHNVGEMLTRNTVRISLTWYAAALILMLQLQRADWSAATTPGRLARWCWTWAVVVFLVHLAMAFHFYHGWSHADAFERTRQVSGTGEGIYTSYLFTLLWVADAAWWWIRPAAYAARSRWFDRLLHAFMLFIVFNGMVVYEKGAIRYAGIMMFAAFAVAWCLARGTARLQSA